MLQLTCRSGGITRRVPLIRPRFRVQFCGATSDHVDFKTGTIHIERTAAREEHGFRLRSHPKNDASNRRIPTTEIEILRNLRKAQLAARYQGTYVFTDEEGQPLNPARVDWAFAKAVKQAGLRPIESWSVRVWVASRLLSEGVPISVVQHLGGWASPRILLAIYRVLMPSEQEQAIKVMQRLLAAQGDSERPQKVSKWVSD